MAVVVVEARASCWFGVCETRGWVVGGMVGGVVVVGGVGEGWGGGAGGTV